MERVSLQFTGAEPTRTITWRGSAEHFRSRPQSTLQRKVPELFVATRGEPRLQTLSELARDRAGLARSLVRLLLSRVTEHGTQILGLVALAPSPASKPNPRQTLLLTSIAEQLASS